MWVDRLGVIDMPVIVTFIFMIVGPMIWYVFRIIGLGFVTYLGFNVVVDQALQYAMSNAGALAPALQNLLGIAKFDVAVSIYFSAITTRMIIAGINKAQDLKRAQVWKPWTGGKEM
ncbi:DUF2523 domain-containing protein [Stutzerimonas kirkiae]|nr:DUF2523 domain-containing protein [Stutzerimonas kirkiae]